ncbi:uncharacterized protein N7482_002332 [Penicillium canariense]|uniref:Cytokinesis regulator n=1 Tax=Penicillium canariense TaxID=189055 RepID=A0A9W9IIJ8_9EURO|nr:uncharacterized protein N7482_002332 [Penicillium canariense]KAJ5176455.1 hypothetical protein N7482_002332 [Penicillium canariense]
MESPAAPARPHGDEMIECWDDDDDLQFNDGIQFRAASSTGSVTNSSFRPSGHRDSISSRRSARSELDSNAGDEDWQVHLHDNDDFSKEEALASAKHAGIPIPSDIPSSALIGGAIKRLSARKQKRTFVDDWSDDVELPDPDAILELKTPQDISFPESLRQISSAATSPVKSTASPSWNDDISTRLQAAFAPLDRFQDQSSGPVHQDVPTIKAPTPRSPQKNAPGAAGRSRAAEREADGFDEDLELPPAHQPLQLAHRKDSTEVSSPIMDDFDLEWSEGSIGVRVGGTARDSRSVPSSSISIASPSVSSCLTAESEEDGLDGVLFPEGPLDFTASLKRRQEAQATERPVEAPGPQKAPISPDADDFFSGIEVDHGRAFVSGKLAFNPNVKCKTEWPTSPTRRPATTLTFTNSTGGSPRTRIPRLSGHERTHSTHLETVSESGAPLSKFRRSQSRLGHSSQSSVSSLPAIGTHSTSPPTPVTTVRQLLGPGSSTETPAVNENKAPQRHLRTKRSLPSIRGGTSATSTRASQRSPSHPDGSIRPSLNRPKTPIERMAALDGRASVRRVQAPFLSAGASERKAHHPSVKSYRPSRRTSSDSSGDLLSPPGTFSRLSRSTRPESLRLSLDDSRTETAGSTAKRTLTKPTRRRNFGDGTELESFDDLPTSVSTESKFTKNPAGRGAPRSVRARLSQSRITPPVESPTQSTPPSVSKPLNSTPRFARDTNASRNAREQRIASMNSRNRDTTPLSAANSNWKPHPVISRLSPSAAPVRSRKSKPAVKTSSKPHLIKPLGSGVQDAKSVRGMRYNPSTFRWEGNENLVQDFEVATAPKSPKPAPALITNVGPRHNVQAVGGMVFDPQRMCWLKASALESGAYGGVAPDDDDVFAGLDDLEENKTAGPTGRDSGAVDEFHSHTPGGEDASAGESSDECPITEEFDVGPEFIRRQRAEEDKWRRKVDKWVGPTRNDREYPWRWAIRDLVAEDTGHFTG